MQKLPFVLIFALFGFFCLNGCEKKIDFPLNGSIAGIFVEAYIVNEGVNYVALQRAVSYSDSNIYEPVRNALVIVTDSEGQRDTFPETFPGLYIGFKLKPVPFRQYYMYAVAGADTLTAATTLPGVIPIDTAFVYYQSEGTVIRPKEHFYPVVASRDPDTLGNYYRFQFYRNNDLQKLPLEYILLDDRFFNGQELIQNLAYQCDPGDSLRFALRALDKEGYNIFTSIVAQRNAGSPFAPPGGNILTNINGGYGYFLGISSSEYQMVVP